MFCHRQESTGPSGVFDADVETYHHDARQELDQDLAIGRDVLSKDDHAVVPRRFLSSSSAEYGNEDPPRVVNIQGVRYNNR